jgi:hypothetical protein
MFLAYAALRLRPGVPAYLGRVDDKVGASQGLWPIGGTGKTQARA